MSLITNLPNGVTNAPYSGTRGMIGVPDYIPVIEYSDDFVGFSDIGAVGTFTPASHTVTNANSATTAQTAGIYGGAITLTGPTTATQFVIIQTNSGAFAPLQSGAIKPFAIKTRWKATTNVSTNFIIGLCTSSTTLYTAGHIVDGIYFQYNVGVLTFNMISAATGNTTSVTLTAPADTVYISLGARYNSDTGLVDVLINEVVVASVSSANVTGAAVVPTIAEKAATTAANVVTIDYLDIVQVR